MKHTHTFQFDMEGFESLETPDTHIKFEIDGSVQLSTLLEHFKAYVVAAGFIVDPGDDLMFLPKDSKIFTTEEFENAAFKEAVRLLKDGFGGPQDLKLADVMPKHERPAQEPASPVSEAPVAEGLPCYPSGVDGEDPKF